LVTALAFFTLLRHSPKLQGFPFLPFGMAVAGLLYGFGVGVLNVGLFQASFDLLNWLTPVLFAFYLLVNWREFPDFRRVTQHTFAWGLLVMGLYGILQFVNPPSWDQTWLRSTALAASSFGNIGGSPFGNLEPFGIRVWSTLNSPGPFALVAMAGLLVLLSSGTLRRWPALVVGTISFLLSLYRTAWGGFVVGFAVLVAYGGRSRLRLLVGSVVAITMLWLLMSFAPSPVANVINARLETFNNLQQDTSFQDRWERYQQLASRALLNPLGEGLGSTGESTKLASEGGELGELGILDSGILSIAFSLGWLGTLLYLGGLIWLFLYTLRRTKLSDPFVAASIGIVAGALSQLILANVVVSVSGMVLWSFLGLAVAARVFHAHDVDEYQETK
jgi:hypothetical protein